MSKVEYFGGGFGKFANSEQLATEHPELKFYTSNAFTKAFGKEEGGDTINQNAHLVFKDYAEGKIPRLQKSAGNNMSRFHSSLEGWLNGQNDIVSILDSPNPSLAYRDTIVSHVSESVPYAAMLGTSFLEMQASEIQDFIVWMLPKWINSYSPQHLISPNYINSHVGDYMSLERGARFNGLQALTLHEGALKSGARRTNGRLYGDAAFAEALVDYVVSKFLILNLSGNRNVAAPMAVWRKDLTDPLEGFVVDILVADTTSPYRTSNGLWTNPASGSAFFKANSKEKSPHGLYVLRLNVMAGTHSYDTAGLWLRNGRGVNQALVPVMKQYGINMTEEGISFQLTEDKTTPILSSDPYHFSRVTSINLLTGVSGQSVHPQLAPAAHLSTLSDYISQVQYGAVWAPEDWAFEHIGSTSRWTEADKPHPEGVKMLLTNNAFTDILRRNTYETRKNKLYRFKESLMKLNQIRAHVGDLEIEIREKKRNEQMIRRVGAESWAKIKDKLDFHPELRTLLLAGSEKTIKSVVDKLSQ